VTTEQTGDVDGSFTIPESLYRLIALCGLFMCKAAISAKLTAMQQLGVGVSSGSEAIATAVRLHIDEILGGADEVDASDRLISVVLKLDATNAFNTVDRCAPFRRPFRSTRASLAAAWASCPPPLCA